MNKLLYYTSIAVIVGYTILYILIPSNTRLFAVTWIGLVASVCNHGTSSQCAKWIDRFYMTIIAVIYAQYSFPGIHRIMILQILLNMCLLYFYAKITDNVYYHAILHAKAFLFICAAILYHE